MESGIVSVVAVAYSSVAAKEDSAGVLAAVDLEPCGCVEFNSGFIGDGGGGRFVDGRGGRFDGGVVAVACSVDPAAT